VSTSQAWFNLFLAAVAAFSTIYSIRAGIKGRNADRAQQSLAVVSTTEQEDRKQRFAELVRSLEEARNDLAYYKNELGESRRAEQDLDRKLDRLQNEWRLRHRELLARCKEMSDVMTRILNTTPNLDAGQRQRIREAIWRVRQHIAHDHEEIETDLGDTPPNGVPKVTS
jgi:chromosome segregation ATPase